MQPQGREGYAGPGSSQQGGMQSSPKGTGAEPQPLATFALFKPQKHDTFVLTDNNLIHCPQATVCRRTYIKIWGSIRPRKTTLALMTGAN